MNSESDEVFVIMQIGGKDTTERRRADELFAHVITPVVEAVGLKPYRADRDFSPGPITPQMLSKLLGSRLVIADLTGRNPNVFYELGISHSFAMPLIAIADSVSQLPFDAKDERVIELGQYAEAGLVISQAETAKENLRQSLAVVLAEGYVPPSPVRDIAGTASLDALKPDDPLAAELSYLGEAITEIREVVKRPVRAVVPVEMQESYNAMRAAFESLVENGLLDPNMSISHLITDSTSPAHDQWAKKLIDRRPTASDPWNANGTPGNPWDQTPSQSDPRSARDPWADQPGVGDDDPPF